MLISRRFIPALAKCSVAGASLAMLAISAASSAQAPRRGEAELVDRSQPADLDFSVSRDGIPNLASIPVSYTHLTLPTIYSV